MAIDLRSERIIRFAAVPAQPNLPDRRGGKRIHVSTIHRWRSAGMRGVRLEALRVGGTWCTSIEALQRFFVRLAEAQEKAPPTTERRAHDLDAVDRKLDEENIK
jgi:Protein of unknown function (DUF1580)